MGNLGFGFMRLPLLEPENPVSIDLKQVKKMVDMYIEAGFNYFDTAYPYHQGKSEIAVRDAVVKRYPRDSFVLADKMPTWLVTKNSDYQKFFDEQLERCQVEYFDYYMLHSMGAKVYKDTVKHGGFEFMQKLKAEGKAKKIGLSFHDKAAVLDKILTEHPEMEFVQLQINYIDWEDEGVESRKCYEVARKHNKPIIVMEPVKGGSLAKVTKEAETLFKSHHDDMSVVSWAVRYTASLEGVFMVLSGMSDLQQMEDNLSYMKNFKPLNEEEQKTVAFAADIIKGSIAIPCTACRYCMDDCPQNIAIADYFSLYNNQHEFGFKPLHANYYMNLNQSKGKASDCIDCKICESHCPQHIAIAKQMKEVAKVFEG